ncbi:MAG TPA: hypothetical protein VGI83_09150 [Gemmatimonadales bacterium]
MHAGPVAEVAGDAVIPGHPGGHPDLVRATLVSGGAVLERDDETLVRL